MLSPCGSEFTWSPLPQFPTYLNFVNRPMCLENLHSALRTIDENGRVSWGSESGLRTVRDFLHALNQVWMNAHAFNPADSDVRKVADIIAKKVKTHFEKEYPRLARLRCDYVDTSPPAGAMSEVVEHIYCVVCGSGEDREINAVVLCGSEQFHTGCGRAFHQHCPGGAGSSVPAGDWFCDECVAVGVPSVARSSVPLLQTEPPMVPLCNILYPIRGALHAQCAEEQAEQAQQASLNRGYHSGHLSTEIGWIGTQSQFTRIVRSGLPGIQAESKDERVHDIFASRAGLAFSLPPGTTAAAAVASTAIDQQYSQQELAVLLASTLAIQDPPFTSVMAKIVQDAKASGEQDGLARSSVQAAVARMSVAKEDSCQHALLWCAYIATRASRQLWARSASNPYRLVGVLRSTLHNALTKALHSRESQSAVLNALESCSTEALLLAHELFAPGAESRQLSTDAANAVHHALCSHTNDAMQGHIDLEELLEGIEHSGNTVRIGGKTLAVSSRPPVAKRARPIDSPTVATPCSVGSPLASGVMVAGMDAAAAALSANDALSGFPLAGQGMMGTAAMAGYPALPASYRGAALQGWLRANGLRLTPPQQHMWDAAGAFTGMDVQPAVFSNGQAPASAWATPMPCDPVHRHKDIADKLRAACSNKLPSGQPLHNFSLALGLDLLKRNTTAPGQG